MSTEFIAEKRANHLAVADKPDMCKVGNTVCAFVSFATFDQATDLRGNPNPTNGQATPVFHMGSYVPKSQGNAGIGVRSGGQSGPFNPEEHSSTVRSQGEFQVHDGHVGQINAATPGSLAGNTTAVVNAGSTGGGEVDVCITKLKLQLANLKEKIAAEWQNSPTDFLWNTATGMGSGVADAGSGMAEGAWGLLEGAWGVVSNPWESAKSAYNSLSSGAKEVYDLGEALYNGELTIDDIVDGIAEALMDALGAAACSVADELQAMLDKPNGGAEGLGYLMGQVTANVAVSVGTAGAGAALKGTQAAALAGQAGAFAMRQGESLAAFFKRLKSRRHERRNRPDPEGGADGKDGSSNTGRDQNPGCRDLGHCGTGNPVNPLYGCKFLSGPEELDFILPGLPSIVWQRHYFSDVAHVGAFGQGWTLPYDVSIELERDGHTLVDAQGRRVPLPAPATGRMAWVPGEEMLFGRQADGSGLLLGDGMGQILCFSPEGKNRWRLSSIRDGYNNTLLLQWNEAGMLAAISSDSQRRVEVEYVETAGGPRAAAIHEVVGRDTRRQLAAYRYTPQGDLSQVYDRTGNLLREFEWRNHVMVMHREPGGMESRYEYDVYSPKGRVVRNWDSLGREWRFIYRNGETRVVDHLRRSTRLRYDDAKRLLAYVDAMGGEMRFDLDQAGNVSCQTDPAGRKRRYARNANGRPILITQPDGAQTFVQYHDGFPWLPASVMDAEGNVRLYEYDQHGSLLAEIDETGGRTAYHRNARGLVVQVQDARGGMARLDYAADGQLLCHEDCSGSKTRYAYDEDGRLVSMSDALGATTHYQHDAGGRLSEIRHPDGGAERFAYDRLGRLIAHSDPNDAITRYRLAPDGRPVARVDALGQALHYDYDEARRLAGLINQNGARYSFTYDVLDRVVQEQGFDGSITLSRYDAAGLLVEKQELGAQGAGAADAIRTRYQHDLAGRLIELTASQARTREHVRLRYRYDALGRLVWSNSNAGELSFRYDPLGRLIEESSAVGGTTLTLAHAYDALGNRIQTTLPDGRNLNWLYYGSGHLHQVNIDGDVVTDMERDALHREVLRTQGCLESRFHYDARGRLLAQQARLMPQAAARGKGLTMPDAMTAPDIGRSYQYDKAGNLLALQDTQSGRTVFAYDAIGRLRQANEERFAFDPASNILDIEQVATATVESTVQAPAWPVGEDGKPHPFDIPPPAPPVMPTGVNDNRVRHFDGHRYVYDAHGNVIERRTRSDNVARFVYDPLHRLVQAEVTRQGSVQRYRYQYDALNRRVIKRDMFGATRFVWNGDQLLAETRAQCTRVYVYGESLFVPLAQIETRKRDGRVVDQLLHYHVDQIGTPLEMTDHAGALVWQSRYRAWGAAVRKADIDAAQATLPDQAIATISQPIRFQGQYYDEETGLHYNRHRYYDPHLGRFISKDPIGLTGGINVYQYAPNPILWVDPFGLACRRPGGYRAHDTDKHGNLSPQVNRAPGNTNTAADGYVQSHHGIQQEWAKQQTFPNGTYSSKTAPAVLLPSTSGSSHAQISAAQRAFRRQHGFDTSIRTEFDEAARQMRAAGVPEDLVRKTIRQNYKYFDCLGGFNDQ